MAKTSVSPIASMIRRLAEDHQTKTLSDQELLRRFGVGQDEVAFASLLRRHGSMVLNVCRNVAGSEEDAEDAFQATFIVLARKAGSIRKLASAASWLHGVAYRTALNGRKTLASRQKHESRAGIARSRESVDDLSWREAQHVIHAELTAVAARYRAPLVLCFLEGRTQDEAAKQLNISKTTLKKRLERGRALLRMRLLRRGLGPAALLAACSWPAATASACLPRALISATVKAATAYASGQTTGGLVSGQVGILVAGALKATLATRLTVATTMLLALALVPTLGGWVFQARPAHAVLGKGAFSAPAPKAATPKAALRGPEKPERKTQILSGRVLDMDGKPAAGAKLLMIGAGDPPVHLGKSAADGNFKVAVTLPKYGQRQYLVARIEGAGVDFIRIPEKPSTKPIELRVVRDLAIRGRIINTEGMPVTGAKVSVTHINVYADNSLDSFLAEWKKQHSMGKSVSGLPYGVKGLDDDSDLFLSESTDADGRFTLQGTGAERFVQLQIRGDGIAEGRLFVVNREGFDPKPYNQATNDNLAAVQGFSPKWLLHGPELAVVAQAQRLIRGVVTDMNTGKARAGIKVGLYRDPTEFASPLLMSRTDSEGRYEIRGARKSESYELEVESDVITGHLSQKVHIKDTPGYEPINADIRVQKGIIVTGRVIDASTNKPLAGDVFIGVLADNSFIKNYPQSELGGLHRTATGGPDTTFRLVTIPGPVVLMGGPEQNENSVWGAKYKPVNSDPKYPQYFGKEDDFSWYNGPGGVQFALQGNFCKVLDIKPAAAIVRQDIVVEEATALSVKITDKVGNPLAGTWATGLSSQSYHYPVHIKTASCFAYHLEPAKPRLMVFYEPTRRLVGTLSLKGDEKESAVATLDRAGGVKGRVLGEDNKPLKGIVVNLSFLERTAAEIHDHIHRAKLVETDSDGKFQIDDVIPGPCFSMAFRRGRQTFEPLVKIDHRSVRAGETLDLGNIQAKRKSKEDN